jgi:hypothetical protein
MIPSRNHVVGCLLSICSLVFLVSCRNTKTPEEYWKVLGVDEKRHFTLVHINQPRNEQTTYVLECSYYKWGERESVKGEDQCAINIGQVIVPHIDANHPNEWVDVDAQNDWVTITMGSGNDRVMQGFKVLSARLQPMK